MKKPKRVTKRPRKVEMTGAGVPVTVRLQPDLLRRLDLGRGGMTRPEKLRQLAEENLPKK